MAVVWLTCKVMGRGMACSPTWHFNVAIIVIIVVALATLITALIAAAGATR